MDTRRPGGRDMVGSRARRSFLAGVASLALAGGMVVAQTTAAHAAPFTMSLVGGSFSLGSQATLALAGTPACQNGSDDEFMPPFGTPDGLIDFPADPQCANAYDND